MVPRDAECTSSTAADPCNSLRMSSSTIPPVLVVGHHTLQNLDANDGCGEVVDDLPQLGVAAGPRVLDVQELEAWSSCIRI